MTRSRLLAAPLAPVVALLLAGCAQSAAKAPAATAASASADMPHEAAPNDLEGQIEALGAAEAQLDRLIGRRSGGTTTGTTAGDKDKGSKKEEQPREPAPPPASPLGAGAGAQKASRAASDDLAADPCVTACSALSSMERAARHLCDLTGDGDARCDSARSRVAGATERVSSSCPACPGPR